ncbi:MAG: methyltransferase domain-containing protein [Myxococcota bacterium]
MAIAPREPSEPAVASTGYSQRFIQGYYRLLSVSYDLSLTAVYRGSRRTLARMLDVQAGAHVLVIGCGTGADFEWLHAAVGPEGSIVGVDFSPAMLNKARSRVERHGYRNVHLIEGDAGLIGAELLGDTMPAAGCFDAVVASLALSVIPGWQAAFAGSWALLAAGGRYGILDGFGKRGIFRLMAPLLDLFAASDIRRPTWALLDDCATGVARDESLFGYLHATVGTKPA